MVRATLDPENRLLYGESLRAPSGYRFDAGVATTFSMDFETALAVPVSLALFAAESRDELLRQPIALIEGAERISGKLAIYADAGRVHGDRSSRSRLCSLLERMVVEVAAPRDGSFHPKLWALRFQSIDDDGPDLVRLLILSRNMTCDRSWDAVVRLDGERTRRPVAANRPLFELISALPGLAVAEVDPAQRELTTRLAEDVRHAHWALPEGCDRLDFAVNGLGRKPWTPGPCSRIAVVSPFCDGATLSMLAEQAGSAPILISRPDQLACVDAETLGSFDRVAVLDEMAEREDGEETTVEALEGLHAKIFVQETGWNTRLTIGSGNATAAALTKACNVEVFATMEGRRSKLGGIEDMLGIEGFGRLTRTFEPGECAARDPLEFDAEHALMIARRTLARAGLRLRCEPSGDADGTWRLWLTPPEQGLALDGLRRVNAWPITRGEGHARDALAALVGGAPLDLGTMPLVDVTRFVAIEVQEALTGRGEVFSTCLPMEGMPQERDAAILNWVIDSRETFFRYLRLLLSEFGDPFTAVLAAQKDGHGAGWEGGVDDQPLLEDLVRSLCAAAGRLDAVDRLMRRLEEGAARESGRVPPEFLQLWQVFREAIAEAPRAG